MRRTAVLLTLALSFLAPLALSVAEAAEAGTVRARATDCRSRRAKKQTSEGKSKDEGKAKKKDKDGKKPYGFEL